MDGLWHCYSHINPDPQIQSVDQLPPRLWQRCSKDLLGARAEELDGPPYCTTHAEKANHTRRIWGWLLIGCSFGDAIYCWVYITWFTTWFPRSFSHKCSRYIAKSMGFPSLISSMSEVHKQMCQVQFPTKVRDAPKEDPEFQSQRGSWWVQAPSFEASQAFEDTSLYLYNLLMNLIYYLYISIRMLYIYDDIHSYCTAYCAFF